MTTTSTTTCCCRHCAGIDPDETSYASVLVGNGGMRGMVESIEARIIANRKSLSGFSVLLTIQRVSQAWASLLVTAVLVAANAALAVTLMNVQSM